MPKDKKKILVGIVMGSQSDWIVMKEAKNLLNDLDILSESKIISAHRTPHRINEYAINASKKGLQIIIAGAGGAAHLPGMLSSHSNLPIIGVPINSTSLNGLDSLLSIVQMPKGVPVGTMAIGESGAKNAAIFAAEILSLNDTSIRDKLHNWKNLLTNSVPLNPK
tara:strand:+ start:10 stop:504 length:495 start_codon:yes stop_codon:yes gene_type:complete